MPVVRVGDLGGGDGGGSTESLGFLQAGSRVVDLSRRNWLRRSDVSGCPDPNCAPSLTGSRPGAGSSAGDLPVDLCGCAEEHPLVLSGQLPRPSRVQAQGLYPPISLHETSS
jgi:hypothetical protein